MFTVIVFIIILGVLVFVHELGHFMVARMNGIKADEFGLGFPPRALGLVRDDKNGKWKFFSGNKEIVSKNTIYSLNWFPIGGFVKIKGEDGGETKDADSFASKPAWVRIAVLVAGVLMNFLFAWILLSTTFMLGTFQDVTGEHASGAKILVQGIEDKSPAQKMGLQIGDMVLAGDIGKFVTVEDVQAYVRANKGQEISLYVQRGGKEIKLRGIPREQIETGQGALGISGLSEVITSKFPFLESLWKGLVEIGTIMLMMLDVLRKLLTGNKTGLAVTGIVGIASYTGQIIPLGFSFLLRFAAILSVNLGIVNILPFPALDGGRILFVLIEKIKGRPVSQKIEQFFHTAGFFALVTLMIVVTYFDLVRIHILDKIKGIF
ncbi:MAG: RIP metalloprotease RseP [Candidatus Moraniibacteriota bacterium]